MSHNDTSLTTDLNRPNAQYSDAVGAAVSAIVFAGLLMIMTGAFHVLQGMVALFNDPFYIVGREYVFQFNVTAWGWIHIALGLIVALAGVSLFRGAAWARTIAIILASLSMLASFAWMPHYPLWSLIIITFDTLVIWAALFHAPNLVDE
jgi:hypothetical protein